MRTIIRYRKPRSGGAQPARCRFVHSIGALLYCGGDLDPEF